MCCMCGWQLSFLLDVTARRQAEGLGLISKIGSVRGYEVLCFVLTLVKFTTTYLLEANDAPCFFALSKHCSWIACSIPQLSTIDLL